MVYVTWVKIFLDDAISDGYNTSKRLQYQEGTVDDEMGLITQIELDDSKITICCKAQPGSENCNYIVIPLNSNVIKYHYGGIKEN